MFHYRQIVDAAQRASVQAGKRFDFLRQRLKPEQRFDWTGIIPKDESRGLLVKV